MGKNRKWIIIIVVFIIITVFLATHKHSFKYNDYWIIGRNIEAVEKRYGEADKFSNRERAYYLHKDQYFPMSNGERMYYIMRLDGEGVVREVYVCGAPGG